MFLHFASINLKAWTVDLRLLHIYYFLPLTLVLLKPHGEDEGGALIDPTRLDFDLTPG